MSPCNYFGSLSFPLLNIYSAQDDEQKESPESGVIDYSILPLVLHNCLLSGYAHGRGQQVVVGRGPFCNLDRHYFLILIPAFSARSVEEEKLDGTFLPPFSE